MQKKIIRIYTCLLWVMLAVACRQEDAQVTPVGKPVPYNGTSSYISQLLDSASLNTFKAAWKKANMDSVISARGLKGYTILAPSDAALAAAGITLNAVSNMDVNELDTLLFYHTMDSWLSSGTLQAQIGNTTMQSLLKRGNFSDYSDWTPYTYLQSLGYHGGKLMVNGKPHTLQAIDAINGTIYVLDEVIKKPEQDMITYLRNNPDFTFFMEACRINDSIYQQVWGSQKFTPLLTASSWYPAFTFFAPTNEAFHKAGFNSFDDLLARASRYEVSWAYYNDHNYYVYPFTSLDSILQANHMDLNASNALSYPMQLFSNDLTDNPSLTNYLLRPGAQYQSAPVYLRLSFSQSGNKIMTQEPGSPNPAVAIDTTDLLFLNGVIHVINDGLFRP